MIRISFILAIALLSQVAFGHGYISNARSKLCQEGVNTNCGSIQYEPQSVEGPDRFPASGPADGAIAAGGNARFSPLNEQTPNRWSKNPISAGNNNFRWIFTAGHRSLDFRYFITKSGWNPSQPLSRNSFDLTPFCTHSGNNSVPGNNLTHNCNVPSRSGYHVILGVWDVADTVNSFYSVVDVQFGGTPTPTPAYRDIGDINPSANLPVGSLVRLRLFSAQGELSSQQIEMTIDSENSGQENTWPRDFAALINSQSSALLAGRQNTAGAILPSFGKNDVFVLDNSNIVRAEVEIDVNDDLGAPDIDLSVPTTSFTTAASVDIDFSVDTNQELNVSAELFHLGIVVGRVSAEVASSNSFTITLDDPSEGNYKLVVVAVRSEDGQSIQASSNISFTDPVTDGDYQYTYPDRRGSYSAGTLVLGQDGNIYECKVAGWCNSRSAQYYAPGYGWASDRAWQLSQAGTPRDRAPAHIYPYGRGQYAAGDIVQGSDGNAYRCTVPGWCNSPSAFYYAPGTGLAWSSAWAAQ